MNASEFVQQFSVAQAVEAAVSQQILTEERPLVLFQELTVFEDNCVQLQKHFPPSALHSFAIKANPLRRILERAVRAGLGLEAASIEEVELALAAGCAPNRIIFDSPAKTRCELERALSLGVVLHLDSWRELERVAALNPEKCASRIGLRINPMVGAGAIAATSVATATSKFGVTYDEAPRILEAFTQHRWLTGLHVHVGSQGGSLQPLVLAASRLVELAHQIEHHLGQGRVKSLDIGGGLSVQYRDDEVPPSLSEYGAALQKDVPELFAGRWQLITELGRALVASTGYAVSRVEYVKGRTAVIHAGADLLLRRIYAPNDWHHRVLVLSPDGRPKRGASTQRWRLVGPLCFAGDVLGEYDLPEIAEGDLIVIRDTGAYTLSMWSRHCSRAIPAVLGYRRDAPAAFEVLRQRESAADLVRFWSES